MVAIVEVAFALGMFGHALDREAVAREGGAEASSHRAAVIPHLQQWPDRQ